MLQPVRATCKVVRSRSSTEFAKKKVSKRKRGTSWNNIVPPRFIIVQLWLIKLNFYEFF